jgi:site-specific recombinase XerD
VDSTAEKKTCGDSYQNIYLLMSMRLEGFKSVERWLTKLSKKSDSTETKRKYLLALRLFCEYGGLNPDELYAERDEDLKSNDRLKQKRAEDRLDRWFTVLTNTLSGKTGEKLSRNTCVLYYNAVRSFYKANHVELQMEDTPASWTEKSKKTLTQEDLASMVEASHLPMHRAYILCQAQSGLGVGDLLRISHKDVAKQIENRQDYVHLNLLRGKRKELGYFDTFFGKVAVAALKEYLPEHEGSEEVFPCTRRNVNGFLSRISVRAGLEWAISSHILRDFFSGQLKTTRVNDVRFNDTLIEYWMGHSIGRTRKAYLPSIEEQLKLYKQAEKRLEPIKY